MAALVAMYVISLHNGISTQILTIFVLEVCLAIVRYFLYQGFFKIEHFSKSRISQNQDVFKILTVLMVSGDYGL